VSDHDQPTTELEALEVGTQLPTIERTPDLSTSVAYAGASGDLNPLHYDPSFAAEVSPTGGIIAHGMYAMGLASQVLTRAAGGPERVRELQVRFSRPWPLGTTATFGGKVSAIEDGVATVELTGTTEDGARILRGRGRITL
jgi:acyl dehydratase